MTIVGLTGILLSLLGLLFASVRPSQQRTIFAIILILLHIAASLAYHAYAVANPADTQLYFYDPARMRTWPFSFGTVFLVQLIYALKGLFGGTYLDYFLLFQAFGSWGIMLLFRTFQEIHDQLNQRPSQLSYALLLFPGLHFWTSALGKDAPMFLGVSLAVWAAIRLPRRLPAFVVGVVLMVLFRPHIALVATVAIALSAFLDRRANRLAKTALLLIAVVATGYVAASVKSTFNVDVTNADSVSDFFATQHDVAQTIKGGTAVRDASYPVRLFSLLFRPMFIDANGFMALIASAENVVFAFLLGFLGIHFRESLWLQRRVFFLRFALLFTVALIVLLTMVYYNVGLGSRQKVMIYPAIFSFVVAVWAFHRGQLWTARAAHASRGPVETSAIAGGPAMAKGAE